MPIIGNIQQNYIIIQYNNYHLYFILTKSTMCLSIGVNTQTIISKIQSQDTIEIVAEF